MHISLIFPSSRPSPETLERALAHQEPLGLEVFYTPPQEPSPIPFHAGSVAERTKELLEALTSTSTKTVLCGRGGYGASDLLDRIPWEQLKNTPTKWVVGFSDGTALLSALYTHLGWLSVHGPLLATDAFDHRGEDTRELLEILTGRKTSGSIAIQAVGPTPAKLLPTQGVLLGGCLSVLVSLIGTAYYPESNKPTILFWEDISETPQRILRYWNQFLQSGVLKNVVAIVIGRIMDIPHSDKLDYANQNWIKEQIALRTQIPVYSSEDFGHGNLVNHPLVIGAHAKITDRSLTWEIRL